jgi:DNA-binding CsgD family transcriptional regulator/N-acetylneuraminic acid mutarotase
MVESNVLSGRESEILILVAKGASNKEIARDLHISSNTVKVHMRNIFAKIDANSRTEAAMYAVNTGLVEIEGNGSADTGEPRPQISNRLLIIGTGLLSAFLIIIFIAVLLNRQPNNSTLPISNPPILDEDQRWQSNAPMKEARKGIALTTYDGQIYAIGGENEQEITGSVESYDPIQDNWSSLKSKPVPVSDISAGIIGGKIYVPGGRTDSNKVSDVLEIYSPGEDEWESGSNLPIGLSSYAMVSYEGHLYVFGGWDGNQVVNSVYKYDPDSDRWQVLTPMPTARAYHGASVIDEKIYVVGGFDGENALGTIEVYSPALEGGDSTPWAVEPPLPNSRYAMGVAGMADRIFVVGGESGPGETTAFMGFTADSDSWEEFSESITADWSYLGVVPVGTHLYMIGGELDGRLTNQNLAYKVLYTIAIPIVR